MKRFGILIEQLKVAKLEYRLELELGKPYRVKHLADIKATVTRIANQMVNWGKDKDLHLVKVVFELGFKKNKTIFLCVPKSTVEDEILAFLNFRAKGENVRIISTEELILGYKE